MYEKAAGSSDMSAVTREKTDYPPMQFIFNSKLKLTHTW